MLKKVANFHFLRQLDLIESNSYSVVIIFVVVIQLVMKIKFLIV
jgi:hypothetical protein